MIRPGLISAPQWEAQPETAQPRTATELAAAYRELVDKPSHVEWQESDAGPFFGPDFRFRFPFAEPAPITVAGFPLVVDPTMRTDEIKFAARKTAVPCDIYDHAVPSDSLDTHTLYTKETADDGQERNSP